MRVWIEYKDEWGTIMQNEVEMTDAETKIMLASSYVIFPDSIESGVTNSYLMVKGEIIESTFVNTGFYKNQPYLKVKVNIIEKPVNM